MWYVECNKDDEEEEKSSVLVEPRSAGSYKANWEGPSFLAMIYDSTHGKHVRTKWGRFIRMGN